MTDNYLGKKKKIICECLWCIRGLESLFMRKDPTITIPFRLDLLIFPNHSFRTRLLAISIEIRNLHVHMALRIKLKSDCQIIQT